MPQRQLRIHTFQQAREEAEKGSAEGWCFLLNSYARLCLHLLGVYAPADSAPPLEVLKRTLKKLMEDNFARFRATPRQSEREFLSDIRTLLLAAALDSAAGREANAPSGSSESVSWSIEKLAALVEGLPLVHQEMIFFRLSGYTDPSIESMLRIAPRVAQVAFARLEPEFAAASRLESDRCPWPVGWLALLEQVRTTKKENCPGLYQFLRIQDGQVSWYEKEPVEKHVASCLFCLERWSALRELGYWRHRSKPLTAQQMNELTAVLPIGPKPNTPLFRRMFG